MQTIACMIAILFAIAVLVVALFHEVQWRRRLTLWNKTDGTIVGEVEQEDYVHAEIEYFRNGQKAVFMSKYGGGGCRIGRKVVVVYNPISDEAEQLNWSNRWLFTIAPIIFSAIFFWVGLTTW